MTFMLPRTIILPANPAGRRQEWLMLATGLPRRSAPDTKDPLNTKTRPGRPPAARAGEARHGEGSGPATGGVQAGQLQLVTRPPVITTWPATRSGSAQIVYDPAASSG